MFVYDIDWQGMHKKNFLSILESQNQQLLQMTLNKGKQLMQGKSATHTGGEKATERTIQGIDPDDKAIK